MKPGSASQPSPPFAAPRNCILVVEDEILIRMMVSDELRDAGFHVIEACDADEALTILRTIVPDIIVSDIRMPGSLDGLGLLAAARESFPELPVIITSSHLPSTAPVRDAVTQFIAKPYRPEAILEAIYAELAKSR